MGSSETGEGQQTTTDSNVVPLPRDWLGPRDELVPIGPPEPEEPPGSAPTAADFWSEGSANVQTAWRGPDLEPAPPEVSPPQSAADVASDGARRRLGLRRPIRWRVAAGVAMVAGAAAIIVVSSLGSSSSAPSAQLTARNSVAAHRLHSTLWQQGQQYHRPTKSRPAVHARGRVESAFKHAVAVDLRAHARAARARKAKASAARRAAATQPVASTVATTVQTPTTYVAPTSSETGSGAVSSHASASASTPSPSNAPAFGATGVLGPGSSPNG